MPNKKLFKSSRMPVILMLTIAVIALLFLLVSGAFLWHYSLTEKIDQLTLSQSALQQKLQKAQPATVEEVPAEVEEVEEEQFATYTSDRLAISFSYPLEWKALTETFEELTGQVTIRNNGDIFLAANNPDYKAKGDRGAYWGDNALKITSQSYITNYCENKSACELKTNDNGIKYVKVSEKPGLFTGTATNYYIFYPQSNYPGIMLSTHGLSTKILNSEEILDGIVDSLKFVD